MLQAITFVLFVDSVSQFHESTHDKSMWNLMRRSSGMELALEKSVDEGNLNLEFQCHFQP